MKQKTLLMTAVLCLAFSGAANAAGAATHDEHKHEHGAPTATLQLDAGKKWETDTALRQSMASIRQSMAASLHGIHENRFSKRDYASLAKKIEGEVGNIVANCKLGPKADEQLHLVVADLLAGAEVMSGKEKAAKRQDGAVRVIGALEKYGTYFDDPDFKPIAH